MKNNIPQVLLLGNGINLSYGGISWSKLMEIISVRTDFIDKNLLLPLPLQAILVTNNNLKDTMRNYQELFAGEIKTEDQMNFLQQLLTAGFDDILTTNYSYELEAAAANKSRVSFSHISKQQRSTIGRAEPKYLLHTFNRADFNGVENRVWHIHGECRKPDSMILGHYWYGSMLSRMKSLIDDGKDLYYRRQIDNTEQQYLSWLDSFIMGDVYVLGFGFDTAEIDLWWLLNRKKREKAKTGKLWFYEMHSEENYAKVELLRLLGAEISHLNMEKPDSNDPEKERKYRLFYESAIQDIEFRTKSQEENHGSI